MSGFSSKWLELREPLDLAARNADVETAFRERLPSGPLRILDLASGAGSTVAALDGFLESPLEWQLTDYDPALLEVAGQRWGDRISRRQVNLQDDLETLPFEEVTAVTTSAFLDLVSEAFLERLVNRLVAAGKPFLASLTYDGRTAFEPKHASDDVIAGALNSHQKTDKGFGPALGPDAAARAADLFRSRGWQVVEGASDWHAGGADAGFLQEFLGGWAAVGRELGLEEAMLEAWWLDRQALIHDGRLNVMVGHVDFAAFPETR